jgi:DNA polymerase-1
MTELLPQYILYDLEFYAYRFAAGNSQDVEFPGSWWIHTCNHKDALLDFIEHTEGLLAKFPGHDLFLARGDRRNFRHDIWAEYKANRKDRRRPPGYGEFIQGVTDYSKTRGWPTGGFKGVEGDDVLGILNEPGSIIVSGDKDMLTLPGQHLRDGELVEVTKSQADAAFYKQALTGDSSDNYPGCVGIGDKNKLFRSKEWLTADSDAEYWAQVLHQYERAGFDELYAINQARCARILRVGEFDLAAGTPHMWNPPVI